MDNKKMTLPVKGMHCKSCELLVEEQLQDIKGVTQARANFHKSQVEIDYSEAPDIEAVSEAIRKAGYRLEDTPASQALISRERADYKDLGIAALILVGLYFAFRGLGLADLSLVNNSSNLTVLVVLLVGLTAGISTCMALVGGLVLGIAASYSKKHPEANSVQKFRPHLFFNLGRVLGFAFLGGLLGTLGSVFQLSSLVLGILTIVIGLVMLIMGLQLIEIFPIVNRWRLSLPKGLARTLGFSGRHGEYSHRGTLLMGVLTFFLPCGFTQAMQVYAIGTGSFAGGALVMGLFALGTAPGLLGVGGLTSVAKGIFAKRFFKLAGLAVILFAVFNISNGLGLAGWSADINQSPVQVSDPNVTLEDGVQVVRMKEVANGYEPNNFTIRKDIPVRWVIDAQAPYSCASALIVPKYDIRRNLTAGENIIEFTPTEVGKIKFSCSMGMYTGVFNVVSADGSAADSSAVDLEEEITTSGTCGGGGQGGCGGGCGSGSGCGGGGQGGCGGAGGCTCGGAKANNSNPSLNKVETQVLKTTYTLKDDIQPANFKVKVNQPVRLEIDVQEDGSGCMETIMIQDLYEKPQTLIAGQPIVMEFTPTTPGRYLIVCAMNIPRGTITVE